MKKNLYPLIAALICLAFSSILTHAQIESGNHPVGALLYTSDACVGGVYPKTTVPNYRPITLFRYLPGEITVDPYIVTCTSARYRTMNITWRRTASSLYNLNSK